METLGTKNNCHFFFQGVILVDKQLSIPTHYSMCCKKYLLILYLYLFNLTTERCDRKGIIWLVKKNFITEKIFGRQFSVALINFILAIVIINTKILSHSKMGTENKTLHAQNLAYLIRAFQSCTMYKSLVPSIQKLKSFAIFRFG